MKKLLIALVMIPSAFVMYHNTVTLMNMDSKMDQVLVSQENTYDEFFEALSSLEARLAANNAKLVELNDVVTKIGDR